MADKSAIEWTDATWNPVTGCTKITRGCDNCYAARFAERWRGIPGHPYEQGFDLRLWQARLDQPARWRKPRMIFVNSMSDLFHKGVPRAFVDKAFDRMEETDRHIYQVLTKRSSLMRDYLKRRYPGGGAVPVGRTAARPGGRDRSDGNLLGHRRRRKRAERAADAPGMGPRPARPLRSRGGALLLQAMGRRHAEGGRAGPGRRRAQRHAGIFEGGERPCPSNGILTDPLRLSRPVPSSRYPFTKAATFIA